MNRFTRVTGWGLIEAAAALGAVVSAIFPLSRWWWFAELAMNFLPLLSACFALYALLECCRRRWLVVLLAFGIAVADLLPAVLRDSVAPSEPTVPSAETIRILQANVLTGNPNPRLLLSLIERERPDVILLQETGEVWQRNLMAITNEYPSFICEPRGDNLGCAAFLSRRALASLGTSPPELRIRYFSEPRRKASPAVCITLPFPHGELRLFGIHPVAPLSDSSWRKRNAFLQAFAHLVSENTRTVVTGDFNTSSYTPVYRRFLRDSGLRDTDSGFLPFLTWHTELPGIFRIPLDHCLCSPDLRVRSLRRCESIGSDHFPFLLEIER